MGFRDRGPRRPADVVRRGRSGCDQITCSQRTEAAPPARQRSRQASPGPTVTQEDARDRGPSWSVKTINGSLPAGHGGRQSTGPRPRCSRNRMRDAAESDRGVPGSPLPGAPRSLCACSQTPRGRWAGRGLPWVVSSSCPRVQDALLRGAVQQPRAGGPSGQWGARASCLGRPWVPWGGQTAWAGVHRQRRCLSSGAGRCCEAREDRVSAPPWHDSVPEAQCT